MADYSVELFLGSLAFAVVGLGFIAFLFMRKANILRIANARAKATTDRAERDAAQIIFDAKQEGDRLLAEADSKINSAEDRLERLKTADRDLIERLNSARKRLETMTDIAGQQAGSIEMITEEDLLSSQEYQKDRKTVKAALKKAALDAVQNVRGTGSDVNIGKYVGISAKSDIAGSLLLITTEMLCAKTTASTGRASIEKLQDSIKATGALLKAVDSRAELAPEFVELLEKRLRIEINYKRAKQVARERQQEVRAQEREEAKARKEAVKAEAEALKLEEYKRQAIAELEEKMLAESEAERAQHSAELESLKLELVQAQEQAERARSRAQDTKQGHVYIISNVGSFGDDVLKIGMTRRLNPIDRVRELGDASVPFAFDIHAMIESDDAPALENELHRLFDGRRLNKANRRKEYFRVTIDEIEAKLHDEGIEALVIPVASADEYYESMRLEEAPATQSSQH